MNNKYDVIVLGSGMAGMMTSMLSQKLFNKKTLLIEKHFSLGGCTHTFKRRVKDYNYEFCVGVHYLGDNDVKKGGLMPIIMSYLSGGKIKFSPLPYEYDIAHIDGFIFKVPSSRKEYEKRLIDLFPSEKEAILKYFNDIYLACKKIMKIKTIYNIMRGPLAPFMNIPYKNLEIYKLTLKDYLDKYFKDDKLKKILQYCWGDYGSPPYVAPFYTHAIIVNHYFDGAYTINNGSAEIGLNFEKRYSDLGGHYIVDSAVQEILLDKNKAIGIKLESGEEFFADNIISAVGLKNTYLHLLKNVPFLKRERANIANIKDTMSFFDIFIGFKCNPNKVGVDGSNHWIKDGDDEFFISCESLNHKKENQDYSSQIIALLDNKIFDKFKNSSIENRDAEYLKLKEELTNKYLNLIEKVYPGFRDIIEYCEASTPLTQSYFLNSYNGSPYGVCIDKNLKPPYNNIYGKIKNLVCVDSRLVSPGVEPAAIAGLLGATSLLAKTINPKKTIDNFASMVKELYVDYFEINDVSEEDKKEIMENIQR